MNAGWGKRRFDRRAQDTKLIEVQGQPLPTGRQAEPLGLSPSGLSSGRWQAPTFRSGSGRVDYFISGPFRREDYRGKGSDGDLVLSRIEVERDAYLNLVSS